MAEQWRDSRDAEPEASADRRGQVGIELVTLSSELDRAWQQLERLEKQLVPVLREPIPTDPSGDAVPMERRVQTAEAVYQERCRAEALANKLLELNERLEV